MQYSVLDANIATKCSLFLVKDGCASLSKDSEFDLYTAFEYEGIKLIQMNSPEIQAIPYKIPKSLKDVDSKYCLSYVHFSNDNPVIINEFIDDSYLWNDSTYQIVKIPSFLQNTQYISSFHSDRGAFDSKYLTISTRSRTKFYILWPAHNVIPHWLDTNFRYTNSSIQVFPPLFDLLVYEMESIGPHKNIILGGTDGQRKARNQTTYVVVFKEDSKSIINKLEYQPADLQFYIQNEVPEIASKYIMENNENIQLFPPFKHTFMHLIALYDRIDILHLLTKNNFNIKKWIDIKDKNGDTPLIIACRHNNKAVITHLILVN